MGQYNGACVCVLSLVVGVVVSCYVAPTECYNPLEECPFEGSTGSYTPSHNVTSVDKDLLELALNLEFLETEWFLFCAFGYGLDHIAPELAKGGPRPTGVQRADLNEFTFNISIQFGYQEVGHLRAILKTVEGFPRPLLNLSKGVWAEIMNEAFRSQLTPDFNPYEDSLKFMIASYVIPYVGLTGYVGANPHLESYTAKRLVAGLLGVESGQDAVIRTYLYRKKDVKVGGYDYTVADFTKRISGLRNRLGRTGNVDEGVVVPKCVGAQNKTTQNVLAADQYSLSYSRTPAQILRILYGTGTESFPGAFFPKGARGHIAKSFLNTSSTSTFHPI